MLWVKPSLQTAAAPEATCSSDPGYPLQITPASSAVQRDPALPSAWAVLRTREAGASAWPKNVKVELHVSSRVSQREVSPVSGWALPPTLPAIRCRFSWWRFECEFPNAGSSGVGPLTLSITKEERLADSFILSHSLPGNFRTLGHVGPGAPCGGGFGITGRASFPCRLPGPSLEVCRSGKWPRGDWWWLVVVQSLSRV